MAAAAAAATIRCCRIIPLSSKRSCCCCNCCSDGGGLGLLHLREGERERVRPRARARLSYLMASTTTTSSSNFNFIFCSSRARRGVHNVLRSSLDAKSKSNTPQLQLATPNFSQQEDDCESPPEGPVSVTGGVVALGKFDALHIGHRELAMQASNAGNPFLLSFVGMAEVLGWEWRAPIVAKCDRKRVLSSWAPYCGSVAPAEFHVEFSSVRHLSPRQFVEKLAKELGVRGVVAGENYRFGYKAAGDASELVKLCEEYGMEAYIVSSVMDKNQSTRVKIPLGMKEKGQVSSTRVRLALADGDIKYVSELLGRSHRLVLALSEEEGFIQRENRMSAPKSCLLNLPPKDGYYETCNCLIDDNLAVSCTTMIDDTHIHVESNQQIPFQDCSLISIEFGWT